MKLRFLLQGIYVLISIIFLGTSCSESETATEQRSQETGKLFTTIPASISNVNFQNKLVETATSNYYKYMYAYIGGGVAAGDFNQDGLEDLFFVSNTFDNKLYLNQGDFKFKDITEAAGIEKREGFDAGVTVVDVNNDGWLDIYITRGGWKSDNGAFANMLYINNGLQADGTTPSFTEKATEHGLADDNRAIQATFFDYDKDGDLDVYISNTPDFEDRAADIVDLVAAQTDPKTFALKGSDKLYQNNGTGRFTDVSTQAGILPDIGFGLNPQVGDLNQDGWLDVYVCNDFRIPDFAYLNNGDGTFREGRNELLKHMSFNSMGSDIADINNDGLLDLYTLDMNPEDYIRSKTTMGMTQQSRFEQMVAMNYHHQYMHNMLQVNNGNGSFREIANLAGVANTDWSWAALLADFDLDGYNDIFVTNGVFRDVIDRDANNAILEDLRTNPRKPSDEDFLNFTKMLPQQKLTNYFFRNKGDLSFENVSYTWADSIPNFSNGAAYTDLDNDGDLDVVINNINDPASILRNNSIENAKGNYLKVQLTGADQNKMGVGARVKLYLTNGQILTRQLINSRGFLSAVSNTLHFGLATNEAV
ncbi:MAG: CRTAC1 family protein, partial [Bacteroidota bacterium]